MSSFKVIVSTILLIALSQKSAGQSSAEAFYQSIDSLENTNNRVFPTLTDSLLKVAEENYQADLALKARIYFYFAKADRLLNQNLLPAAEKSFRLRQYDPKRLLEAVLTHLEVVDPCR